MQVRKRIVGGTEEQLWKSTVSTIVQYPNAVRDMGKSLSFIFFLILNRSEGSLVQHIKLKHKEYYA